MKLFLNTKIILFFVGSLVCAEGFASSGFYSSKVGQAKRAIIKNNLITWGRPSSCNDQTMEMREDGQITILAAFGYMDISDGRSERDGAYSNGDVIDGIASQAFINGLEKGCTKKKNTACGFRKSGKYYKKTIRDRWTGKKIKVFVRVIAPSVSSNDRANQGQRASRQQSRSQSVHSEFLSGLKSYDAVIYMGHARSGGGPDFYPPELLGNGRVNYSHYQATEEGIRSMLGSLGSTTNDASVIGVLACRSTGLFARSIKSKAPDSLVVTAGDLFNFSDIVPTGFAMVEAITSQRCSSEFTRVTKIRPDSAPFLHLSY